MNNTYMIPIKGGKSKMPGQSPSDKTRHANEFVVEAELRAATPTVWCGRKIDFLRRGKRSNYEAIESPFLAGYIFAAFPAVYFHDVCKIEGVWGVPVPLTRADLEGIPALYGSNGELLRAERPGLRGFQEFVEAEYQDAKAIEREAERAQRAMDKSAERALLNRKIICEFKKGQALKVTDPRFEYYNMFFREIVQGAHDQHPKIKADFDMMGQTVTVELDPIDVRSAE